MRSLRARLLLTVGAVVLAALTAVAFISSRATRRAFLRLEDVRATHRHDAGPPATSLEEHYRRGGNWEGIPPVVNALAKERQEELVLLDADDKIIAVSPGLAAARIQPDPAGGLRIERATGRSREVVLAKVPAVPVHDASGRTVGRLYPVGLLGAARSKEQREFLGSVDRWIFGGLAAAGVLALLATAGLSRRILKPVEELTSAARRMERGDLAAQVDVRTRDEIGELGRAFNSMAQARARAEELRRRMVGDIAHELRTPLTNLKAQLEAIEDGLLEPDAATQASLREETELLQRLVDDLQDLALAEAGQLKLELAAVSVEEAARVSIAALKSASDSAGVRLESEVPMDLPPALADWKRVGQILRNLLSNAMTHSPRGGTVRVGAVENGSLIQVSVRDQGPGIAPDHLPRIFDRFYRADASRSRSTGGAGLGLAIVRQLARAQGGDVRVESEPGKGASFFFTLPKA
jgi:signal transduction histidine kinase